MISSFEKYVQHYVEPFCNFLSEISSLGDFGFPHGVFFSHPLPDYDTSKKRVFYIGRDTNCWSSFNEMMSRFYDGRIEDYLKDQWPTSADEMMGWGNRMTFWTIVFKLHIYLNHQIIFPRVQDYTEDQKKCLMGIGFGNMNCVEVPDSLKREDLWECIDKDKYSIFKEKSRRFDRLKDILDLYNPDIVYIFSWVDDPIYLQDIELQEDKSKYEDHWRAVYTIKGYNAKLIWTSHPTHLAIKYTRDVDKVVKYLGDSA